MKILSLLIPGKRARMEFAEIVKGLYDMKMIMFDSSDEKECDSFQRRLKDHYDYAKKNFGSDELTKQHLEIAYNSCKNCKRLPENNNCDEVFRRIGLAKDYLMA
jgi:hypothetical protein